ncbi:endonuclease V [Candidatus Latescibacterota bacterium]
MNCPFLSFDVSIDDAKKIQNELKKRVKLSDAISDYGTIKYVGGADVAFIETFTDHPRTKNTDKTRHNDTFPRIGKSDNPDTPKKTVTALAAVVMLDIRDLSIVETECAAAPVTYPYIPGFLSFREGQAILSALGKLKTFPEFMIYDGCGIAHPRGFGLASHMAVLTGIPSIGCAKSSLIGKYEDPGPLKGEWTEIRHKNNIIGNCLRTKNNVKPVFVSPGSGFSIKSSREMVLSLSTKYRLPEPTRRAHNLVTSEKKNYQRIT